MSADQEPADRVSYAAGAHTILAPDDFIASVGMLQEPRPGDDPDAAVDAFQQLINGLPEQIALLDEDWTILTVNAAWRKTAALYDFNNLGPGTNYLRFCRDMAVGGHSSAQAVGDGIIEMIEGRRSSFELVYSGTDRWQGHEFQLRINRLAMAGRRLAIVTRYEVTELVQLRRQREGYSASLIQGQVDERRRVARDIHDSTAQLLASLGLALGRLKRTRRGHQAADIVVEMEGLLAEAQREIRSISYLAHPPLLEGLGLSKALEKLIEGFRRRTDIALTFHDEAALMPGWHSAEVALYRVVQEALSNVHRHAHATEVSVGIFTRRSMIHLVVIDNGAGLPVFVAPGVGLLGMRERISELGGRLAFRAGHPGTVIIASLPLKPTIRAVGDLALYG